MTGQDNAPLFHLSRLADLCREHPTTPKFLFVASRQVGYNLLTAFARSGVEWANLEAMSPREHAARRFEPLLAAGGLRPLRHDAAIVLMAGLLRELKDRDAGGYFEPVAVTPSLANSVWDTVQALRMAGIAPSELEAGPVRTEKTRALAYLLNRLDEVLQERRLYDQASVLDYAIRLGSDLRVDGMAALMDETPMTRRAFTYLRHSFDERLIRIGRSDYGVPIPETVGAKFLALDPKEGGRIGSAASVKSGGLREAETGMVRVFGSRGPEAEIGDVVRYCLENELPLDEVEIAYANGAIYVPPIVDLAYRLQLDVSFAEGVPAGLTRPGAGLKGFLDWIAANCPAAQLADLMRAGLLSFHRVVDEVGAHDMPRLASHFRLAVLDEGMERYLPAVERLGAAADGSARANDDPGENRFQRRTRLLRLGIESLAKLVPTSSKLSMAETAGLCTDFLTRFAVVHGERDERSVESLRDRFSQIADDGVTRLPRRLALQIASDMVERHTVQASTARPGSLHAVSIERAAYSGRKHLFVVGLDVDNFPGRSAEDPILLDIERGKLSSSLDLKASQSTDRIWHLVRALGMAHEHVYFGASAFNAEREEAVVYPSPFFQSVAKELGVDYLSPPPLSSRPFHFDDTAILVQQRRRSDYRKFTDSRFPWMAQGHTATASRKSARITEFDGRLETTGRTLEQIGEDVVFSSNRMEKLAACQYRYFLHYVLGVRKREYYVPDPTRWLDPRDFGTLLHDLYHDFLMELRERDERPDLERDRARLLDLLDEAIDRYRGYFPPDNQAAFGYERQRLEESALVFLRTEASDPDAHPILFEFVFGSDDATSEELRKPVRIRVGEDLAFLFRGRIDRVDILPDGALAVWDYKTGGAYNFDEDNLLSGGLTLQWVLYAYALEELSTLLGLSGRVAHSGYYFASDRENGRRIAEPPPARQTLYHALEPLFSLVRQGAFLHATKKEGECKYCDFKPICGSEAKTAKDLRDMWVPNAGAAFLEPLQKWMEVDG